MLNPTIFREYDIRGTVGSTLTEEDARRIGRAFGERVAQDVPAARVCVGYDGRVSSPMLMRAISDGLRAAGTTVVDVGRCPTPQLYFAVCTLKADGGIMVTGSHNPPDQNGFKFMRGKKPFYGADIQALRLAALSPGEEKRGGGEKAEVSAEYLSALVSAYAAGERELRIAWDAGNGAAGEVMAALSARLPGAHFLLNEKIDGTFPSHPPDPTVPENLAELVETVRREKCDAGIAFDGDADRLAVVDETGAMVWGDELLCFFARDVLAQAKGATVIADVKASEALFDEVRALGGTPLMWKTGHSHIKAKMGETGAPLAGEMSGHFFFADRYFGFDDGLYAAVRFLSWLSRQGKPLSALKAGLPRMVSTPELRFPCEEERKFAIIDEVKERLRARGAKFSEVDGVRVLTAEGWWLLRASNTQAVLGARCEAREERGLPGLKAALAEELAKSGLKVAV